MKKALQESMRNLNRFWLDFSFILEAFSVYFGSQRASKVNKNSGRRLERPLGASGVGFGRPLGAFGGLWERDLAKKNFIQRRPGGMRGDPLRRPIGDGVLDTEA